MSDDSMNLKSQTKCPSKIIHDQENEVAPERQYREDPGRDREPVPEKYRARPRSATEMTRERDRDDTSPRPRQHPARPRPAPDKRIFNPL
ncbi:unnamed protein product [Rhodiola kirilowii]